MTGSRAGTGGVRRAGVVRRTGLHGEIDRTRGIGINRHNSVVAVPAEVGREDRRQIRMELDDESVAARMRVTRSAVGGLERRNKGCVGRIRGPDNNDVMRGVGANAEERRLTASNRKGERVDPGGMRHTRTVSAKPCHKRRLCDRPVAYRSMFHWLMMKKPVAAQLS